MSLCGRWKDKEAIYAAKAAPVMATIPFLRKLQATAKAHSRVPSGTGPAGGLVTCSWVRLWGEEELPRIGPGR